MSSCGFGKGHSFEGSRDGVCECGGYSIREFEVVAVSVRVPNIPINIHDADYEAKISNPANYHPAVLVRLPNGKATSVILNEGEVKSVGDTVWITMPTYELIALLR